MTTIVVAALTMTYLNLVHQLPVEDWLSSPIKDVPDLDRIVFLYALLPRLVISLICGAALATSGAALQQVMRNPLAEPTTLGASAGAQLALMGVALWYPGLLAFGLDTVALAGAALASLAVAFFAFDRHFSPRRLILSGLIITLYAGTLITLMSIFHSDDLGGIFIWSTGTLNQNDWNGVRSLLPRLAICWFALLMIARPLSVTHLGDEAARSLGVPIGIIRLLALIPAVALGAFVTSAVGVIGFVGLAAPALARALGARRFQNHLLVAPIIGAMLLWCTDQGVQILSRFGWIIPTGTATVLLGAPILVWLLVSSRTGFVSAPWAAEQRAGFPRSILLAMLTAVCLSAIGAMIVAKADQGWLLESPLTIGPIFDLRWPRVVGAGTTGAMLAIAGVLIQRLTANPIASPEILGISSAATLGAMVVLLLVPDPSRFEILVAASITATLAFGLIILLTLRGGGTPDRLLMLGLAIGTWASAGSVFLLASGNSRTSQALAWLSGSTYRTSSIDAMVALGALVLSGILLAKATHWLRILPLGDAVSVELGLPMHRVRISLVALTAVLTGVATLVVGPLSFAGLLAPHLARQFGLARAGHQIIGAAFIGAIILIISDWLGRNLLFPSQVPAGLLSSMVGGPYLIIMMYRGRRSLG
ncbi:Fe(3+)-hydroxamate ABC transporter permease FhuB [Rhizobium lusitanum]|uniref:Fe(3+)-hydroxamate ABC transporter permease FhuB n=1 Tax=Rhizobium lusitanum TaxID=293958 RepID=A0A6L9UAN6_9HYPH|nr:Fe(3+)-hydroxamate ABC transporter permease FhuB [Rhizobium lusitanum]NEI72439.1 Fe(3+)-hydroxamate ABC transporter permease FhuB [Rhizobium lusitanum]